ncbi:hypothetical protein J0X14_01045 [Muricauda sp. CAU 1633]|uniref:hypothetical protein n=1 Tax=Allomuricauda sp. CAU 1633 TaxID=2816036 RepID=UPI001A8DCD60|nr:hypothetical protein [Muricauda sp. CAU 1633]MBO0320866.1 hypothetical protein [Muricauda sp. CAU 1633]
MMRTKFEIITTILMVFLFLSCSSSGGETPPPPPSENLTPPEKTIGTVPENGEPCADYTEVINDDSKVLIYFKWSAAQNAENYNLVILEGSNEVFSSTFNVLETEVQLDRGKTYSWFLTSINEDGETKGDTYSFTSPGTPVGNFAPYSAEITVTFNTQMQVSWMGNDEDGDILTYDVTVKNNDLVLAEEVGFGDTSLNPLDFEPGAIYDVEVISKDPYESASVSKTTVTAPN